MKHSRLALFLLSILLQSYNLPDHHTSKWMTLFNGKNLDHWVPKIAGYPLGENFGNTFRADHGVLSTRYDQYDSFNNRFGALYFDRKFKNYRLKLEYRFVGELTHGAPSWGYRDGGIQYHCQPPNSIGLSQPFPVCLEFNLHGADGKGERPTGEICASGMYVEIAGQKNTLFCTPPTVKKTLDGEQWVQAEVLVKDGRITHFVNGEAVLQFEHPHFDSANALGRQFIVNGDDVVRDGYISLQSNSHPMDFRNIAIMEL